MPLGLIALALGGFGIGLTEFVIAGLLPEVAADLGVGVSGAGWLISGYALAVAGGAVAVTAATGRRNRKYVLTGLMVLFVLGNLVSALAPSFAVLMLGRVLAALCHGAFFGVGAVVAADLVAPERRSRAIALMMTGLTLANVLGVPFGTFVGQQFGWRATFWVITGVGVVALLGLLRFIPEHVGPPPASASASVRGEFAVFRSPQVLLSLLATVLGFGGMFGAFTYIAFTLTDVSGFAPTTIPWLLVLFGVGMFVGNLVGGRAADRSIPVTLTVALTLLAVTMGVFAVGAGHQVVAVTTLVLMGFFGFAPTAALQMRVMTYAGHAPTLASGANIGAFNIGNAFGAWLCGLVIAGGLGYAATLWTGALITVGGIVVVLVATRLAMRQAVAVAPGAQVEVALR